MTRTAYTNARLIDPSTSMDVRGTLIESNGKIVAVGADVMPAPDDTIVECGDRILCPGFIDMRAHSVDHHAALAGGITTVILQPDQHTLLDNDAAVERIRQRSSETGSVHVLPMGTATKAMAGEEIAEIGRMQLSGAVAFTDCRKPVSNALVLRRLFEYAGYFNALIVQFAQDKDLAAGGFAHEGEIATRLGLNGIPAIAEAIQIERDARIAELTGARLHIALLSSKVGVDAVRAAKAKGVRITASTAPHYLQLNDNAVEGYRTFAKFSPPLRSEEDRLALIEGLADGTIDCLVSDHDPQSQDVKRLPYAQAAAGMVGFETLLALTLAPVHAGNIDLMTALRALTSAPADILGLSSGTLKVGAPADLTVLDHEKPWRIKTDAFLSAAKNSPFDTLPVQGKVWKTIVSGILKYDATHSVKD
ncbi:dihydroorotase [Kordiimonas sediminis]|uniref:Dihydroorotase n=1 Tax=Kordiimonas sediminis TaxID=1735581 RepID=A0A919E8Q3_9PROT|nr:dihydroorotase [Kordiimonas sediminis]GHF25782.1 dihydroorotase [Kordiimonas sediminis]